jgi:hypothetical protein
LDSNIEKTETWKPGQKLALVGIVERFALLFSLLSRVAIQRKTLQGIAQMKSLASVNQSQTQKKDRP